MSFAGRVRMKCESNCLFDFNECTQLNFHRMHVCVSAMRHWMIHSSHWREPWSRYPVVERRIVDSIEIERKHVNQLTASNGSNSLVVMLFDFEFGQIASMRCGHQQLKEIKLPTSVWIDAAIEYFAGNFCIARILREKIEHNSHANIDMPHPVNEEKWAIELFLSWNHNTINQWIIATGDSIHTSPFAFCFWPTLLLWLRNFA